MNIHTLHTPKQVLPSTSTDLIAIRDDLARREPIFHRPEWGSSRTDFENMTTEDFWEIGASGRIYSRSFVLDELDRRYASPHEDQWETSGFECQKLAQNLYLLTYLLSQGERKTRRATIWTRIDDTWKIVFHQGTVIA